MNRSQTAMEEFVCAGALNEPKIGICIYLRPQTDTRSSHLNATRACAHLSIRSSNIATDVALAREEDETDAKLLVFSLATGVEPLRFPDGSLLTAIDAEDAVVTGGINDVVEGLDRDVLCALGGAGPEVVGSIAGTTFVDCSRLVSSHSLSDSAVDIGSPIDSVLSADSISLICTEEAATAGSEDPSVNGALK
ncbi:hypothetical protein SARC_09463 [Sphaeroforma arctica JP610]|uniref:Uncharacterized protein n=1 Tax=Sphaeroforma arctica JP610 TaxID=667725 RepID=A0A0L0FMV9_9EUKA|nr:hypothetical protein SARC_09463 [Sphaeroforma arctica JP610]KNC78095.1 hypothetical protein SARC_09463 [Sphaeroforma arctica JP610]|eukprot:XP_014151997.1 hypothetical protein SARC_09463 [Sphaeroforma arctica JP610]